MIPFQIESDFKHLYPGKEDIFLTKFEEMRRPLHKICKEDPKASLDKLWEDYDAGNQKLFQLLCSYTVV